MNRYLIYKSRESKSYLCVCVARDNAHALKVARQMFILGRGAFAVKEAA